MVVTMRLGTTVWYCLILWIIDFHFTTADPCLTYEEFNVDFRRSPGHVEEVYEENLCDALVRQKWYRFVGEAGGDMTNDRESVVSYGCGTYYSLWMNGSIPDTGEGIVDRKVCMKSVFADCHSSFTIQVKNCCSYRVYYLQSATACPSSYCVSPSNIITESCTNSSARMSTTTVSTTSKQLVSTTTSPPSTSDPNMVTTPSDVSERTTSPPSTSGPNIVTTPRDVSERTTSPPSTSGPNIVTTPRDVSERTTSPPSTSGPNIVTTPRDVSERTTSSPSTSGPNIVTTPSDVSERTTSPPSTSGPNIVTTPRDVSERTTSPPSTSGPNIVTTPRDVSERTTSSPSTSGPNIVTTPRDVSERTTSSPSNSGPNIVTTPRDVSERTTSPPSTSGPNIVTTPRDVSERTTSPPSTSGPNIVTTPRDVSERTSPPSTSGPNIVTTPRDVSERTTSPSRTGSGPCLTYEEFNVDYRRSPGHVEMVYEENLCDALVRQKWYRFVGEAGGDMTNDRESVVSYGCGTYYSLWMNGSIPDTGEGIVDRKVCMKSVFADCHSSFTIQVKNCCSYRVYYLQSATACPSSYCVSPSNISTEGCTDSPLTTTTRTSPVRTTSTIPRTPRTHGPTQPRTPRTNGPTQPTTVGRRTTHPTTLSTSIWKIQPSSERTSTDTVSGIDKRIVENDLDTYLIFLLVLTSIVLLALGTIVVKYVRGVLRGKSRLYQID